MYIEKNKTRADLRHTEINKLNVCLIYTKKLQIIDLYTNTIDLEQGKQLAVTPVSVIITYVTAAADMHPFELQVLAFQKSWRSFIITVCLFCLFCCFTSQVNSYGQFT